MQPVTKVTGTLPEQMAIARAVREFKDALMRCATRATKPLTDKYIENLRRKAGEQRMTLGEHELAIAFNAFQREAPQQDVEAPFIAALHNIRSWYDARNGRQSADDLLALCKAETAAQGFADVAQWDLRNPTSRTLADADDALTVHVTTLLQLRDAVRRRRYAGESDRAA